MRSLLFVPADSPRKLEKSLQSGADVLIFDLEDAVSPARKEEGRVELVKFLTQTKASGVKTPKLYVRVNALTTGMTLGDLGAVMRCRPDGIALPKSTGVADVALLAAYLEAFEQMFPGAGGEQAQTSILPIVTETAESLAGLNSYRGASGGLKTWRVISARSPTKTKRLPNSGPRPLIWCVTCVSLPRPPRVYPRLIPFQLISIIMRP